MSSLTAASQGFTFGGYAEETPQGVGFWPRAGARIIDNILHTIIGIVAIFMLAVVVGIVIGITGKDSAPIIAKLQTFSILSFVMQLIGYVAYHTLSEGLHGSTLGKLMLGQVVLTSEKQPSGLRAALVRSAAYFLDSLFFGAIGYFEMQKSNLYQRHGDNWAKTAVFKRSQVPKENLRGPGRFVAVLALALFVDGMLAMCGFLMKLF